MSWQLLNPSTVSAAPGQLFADSTLAYCQALSEALLQDPQSRNFADLIGLGFWLRPAQIQRMLQPWRDLPLQPVGTVFHVAPANVDSLFVYSGILSLLCGNHNWIRLSSRTLNNNQGSFAILLRHLRQLATRFPNENARFQLISCPHQHPQLQQLQQQIDARVLWGSSAGIQAMRQQPIPAHARDISFAHKYSLAAIAAKPLCLATPEQLKTLCQAFIRDNLTFAQQACSSAKAIIWIGSAEHILQAQQRFWFALQQQLHDSTALSASEQYQALQQAQLLAATDSAVLSHLQILSPLLRANISQLTEQQSMQHQGCGLFLELQLPALSELNPQLTSSHQTLSYWGFTAGELTQWLPTVRTGLDRLVPIGQALNFQPVWDGIDLIRTFSRQINFIPASAPTAAVSPGVL